MRHSPPSAGVRRSLLFVSPVVPMVSGPGISMRAGLHVLALSKMFDVTLAIVRPRSQDKIDVPAAIRDVCAAVVIVERPSLFQRMSERVSRRQGRLLLEAAWLLPRPLALTAAAANALVEILAGQSFDVVHCFRMQTSHVASLLRSRGIGYGRLAIDVDDYESFARFRSIPQMRSALGVQLTIIRWLEALKFWLAEHRTLPRFDNAYVCSTSDRDTLAQRFPQVMWNVVPNVVPPPVAGGMRRNPGDPLMFLFVGTFDYPPNKDAALFFCHQVLPHLRTLMTVPFKVCLVGRNPDAQVRELVNLGNVEVIGNPASVAPYYHRADISIAPIRAGGGTRIKILEAFSYGIPVVATTIGAEGLDIIPGRQAEVADDANDFARACFRLATDRSRRDRLAQAGYDHYRARFSTAALPGIYAAILGAPSPRQACHLDPAPPSGAGSLELFQG